MICYIVMILILLLILVLTFKLLCKNESVFNKIMKISTKTLGTLIYPIVLIVNSGKKQEVPPITNPLLLISAKKLAQKIRNKEIKCEDVIRAYIERCEQVNPVVNAIVQSRFEDALKDAKCVDELIASNKYAAEELERLYPLLGIPITIKGSISVKGMNHDACTVREKTVLATKDAGCVLRIKGAGGIVLLVSTTPEMCMCTETFNNVTGVTRNPYDTRRTSGGSSGGEAVLISSGASLIGMGSDLAGSIRIPAIYNGIYGMKPSPFAVAQDGHKPRNIDKEFPKYFTFGPFTRYAEDLPLIMKVLNSAMDTKIQLNHVNIKNIKLYYMDNDTSGMLDKVDSNIKKAMEKVVSHFEINHGIQVKKEELKHLKYSYQCSTLALIKFQIKNQETAFTISEDFNETVSMPLAIIKKLLGMSKTTFPSFIHYGMMKYYSFFADEVYERNHKYNENLRQEFIDLLQQDGVFFYPAFKSTATYHYDYFRHMLDFCYSFLFSSLRLPVVTCPVGLTSEGMPVGVQAIASPGCDHLLFSVAKEFEKAFGGWLPPCEVLEKSSDN